MNKGDIRYYRGVVKLKIIFPAGKKAYIEYLERGIVGNKRHRKEVDVFDHDLVLTRHCYRKRKGGVC